MKILLIDVDSTIPNLALMKLSALHKSQGNQVALNRCSRGFNPDRIYISCVFTKNRSKALGIGKMFSCPVEIGGYGVNDKQLPKHIEHIMPDYDLYPGMNFSMGFTSRGCIRECPFCIVWKKEGKIRDHASIKEFWNPKHTRLMLLDNNFLASPKWKENIQFLIKHNLKVSISQGLDIRLMNDEVAFWLQQIESRTPSFKSRMYYFAFDDPSLVDQVDRGIKILNKAGIKSCYLTFYVLCGFNTTHKEDMERFKFLRKLGAWPYIMKYNDRTDDKQLNHFDRWVNGHYYNMCSFKNYKPTKGEIRHG